MAAIIPDKLTPVPNLDRDRLPAWVTDVGTMEPDEDNPSGVFVMVARRGNLDFFHCDVTLAAVVFDDTFWKRFAEPMVNNLGGALFEAEWPGMTRQSIRREVEAAMGQRELTPRESAIIDRRRELTWKAPTLN
jgi:hypothetical protein